MARLGGIAAAIWVSALSAAGAGEYAAPGASSVHLQASDRLSLRIAGGALESAGAETGGDHAGAPADVRFATASGVLAAHPFSDALFLGGGAYVGGRIAPPVGDADGAADYFQALSPAAGPRGEAEVSLEAVSPVVGLGFDNAFDRDKRASVRFMAGAIMTGAADPGLAQEAPAGVQPMVAFSGRLSF